MVDFSLKAQTYSIVSLSVVGLMSLYLLSGERSSTQSRSSVVDVLYRPIPKDQTLCSTDTFNQGKWIHQSIGLESNSIEGINAYSGYHCIWDFPHRCYRRKEPVTEFNRSKAMLDYSWQPDNCAVLSFQPRDLSRHFADNPILLVGDSITQLMFESMWCLLGQDLKAQNSDTKLSGGDTAMWVSQLVHRERTEAQPNVTVGYIRSDYLVKLDDFSLIKPNEGEGYQIGVGNNFPWVHALPRFKYIMINTGPHWHPDLKWGPHKDRAELLKAFKTAMNKLLTYLKQHVREDQRVWVRGSPYGHAKCSQYTSPSLVPVKPTGQPGEYEWDMLEKFDLAWKDLIEQENDSRFQFFNVSLSNARGDAHSMPDHDCLHTCLPGPVDDWNKLLYHEITRYVIQETESI
ncbi:GDSL/SGNH-like acyl-esterase family found in Pmr5 and Cas1p-domain-containing protein [Blakeslea trispora]|nr:GDSL/SGNH-like acyl-esterase family found in Pmr5 and Cas1p-domain-containing protein [Blakeslea trispora]